MAGAAFAKQAVGDPGFKKPKPWGFSRSSLTQFQTTSTSTVQPIDARIPKLVRVSNVIESAIAVYGTAAVGLGRSYYIYDQD